jgi:hypothetical protein
LAPDQLLNTENPDLRVFALHPDHTTQTMPNTDGHANGHPHPIGTPMKPVPRFPPENALTPHPQLWLDRGAGDDTDRDSDDEQEA